MECSIAALIGVLRQAVSWAADVPQKQIERSDWLAAPNRWLR